MDNCEMLNVIKLECNYGREAVLRSISFQAHAHECIGILGRNGTGKTTLFKSLAGVSVHQPTQGKIIINGKNIWPLPQQERASLISYVPASLQLSHDVQLKHFLLNARFHLHHFWSDYSARDHELVQEVAETFKIQNLLKRDLSTLSSGQVQLAMIARGILQDSEILLLDEALNHLDLDHLTFVFSILKRHVETKPKIILWTHHDLNMLSAGSSRILVLHEGMILKDGDPLTVFTEETLSTIFGNRHAYQISVEPTTRRPQIFYKL